MATEIYNQVSGQQNTMGATVSVVLLPAVWFLSWTASSRRYALVTSSAKPLCPRPLADWGLLGFCAHAGSSWHLVILVSSLAPLAPTSG
jgi:ABC-type Fe3+ transport system permease subunit